MPKKDHPLYRTWFGMLQRCYNENNKDFQAYGGAGVRVCEEWRLSFDSFVSDMGDRPKGFTLDRYSKDWRRTDTPLPYSPSTCRWASPVDQARNTKANVMLSINGFEKCISQWSAESGVSDPTIRRRIRQGWDSESAVFTPARAKKKLVKHLYKGRLYTIKDLADMSGVKPCTLHSRLNSGWSIERALST